MAHHAEDALENEIRSNLQNAALLTLVPAVQQAKEPECSQTLLRLLDDPDYLGAIVMDTRGDSVCNGLRTDKPRVSKNYADRDYFKKAMATGAPAVGTPVVGKLTGKAAMGASAPLRNPQGTITGVVVSTIDLEAFGRRFVQSHAQDGSVFLIWNREGTLLFRYPDAEKLTGKQFADLPLVAATASGPSGVLQTTGFDAVARVFGYAPLQQFSDTGLIVGVSMPASAVHARADALLRNTMAGLALFLIVGLAAAWFIGRNQVWRPVGRVVQAAQRLIAGDYSARVQDPPRHCEIAELAAAFDSMAASAQSHTAMLQAANATLEQRVSERTAQLAASEAHFRAILESAADGIVIVDHQGLIQMVNAAALDMFGYHKDELMGKSVDLLMPAASRHKHAKHMQDYAARPVARSMGHRQMLPAQRKDGSAFVAGISLSPTQTPQGTWVTAVVRDMSSVIEAENTLRQMNRTLRVLSQCNEALVRANDEAELLDAICRTVVESGGYPLAWVGFAMHDQACTVLPVASYGGHAGYVQGLHISWADTERGRGPTGCAIREKRIVIGHNLRKDPNFLPWADAAAQHGFFSSVALPLRSRDGVFGALNLYADREGAFTQDELQLLEELADDLAYGINSLRERARRESAETELDYQANFDSLTGLANRNLLLDRLQQALVHAERNARQITVVVLNLDRFKTVNESHGMECGNQLLREVAQRLVDVLREGDTVARLAVDEFGLLMTDMATADDAAALTHKLLQVVSAPFAMANQEVFLSASVGISLYPKDGDSADILLVHATSAMHSAKALGGNMVHYYSPAMNQKAATRLALDAALRRSLERNELVLHYQPVVDLMSGEILGAEALIRWPHPELGVVSPVDFIPLAEETGLIVPIGAWVVHEACRQMRSWLDAGLEVPQIAVNLSAKQFRQQDLLDVVRTALQTHQLQPHMLALEITESTIMVDVEQALQTLHSLKSMGLQLSLDDFGTGYSSLSYLKRFAADRLKIDRSFVRDITSDPDDAAICKAVIALAHTMKMKVIAEGVETEGQMLYLRQQRCDEMQGYYFSRPLPATDFEHLLSSRRKLDVAGIHQHAPLPTLLLVDDEENVLSALKRLLRKDGYRILTATSAKEALELLALHTVHVIVSDQRMPRMSGTELFSRVKELYPNTVRIILSGYTELNSVTEAINQGSIYRFFTKPWIDTDLQHEIKNAFVHFNQQFGDDGPA